MKTKEIIETTNYGQFHYIIGNRPIVEKKVLKLIQSIKQHGLLQPIIVDKTLGIVDGQHRLEACRRINFPVQYIINPEVSISEIREMNSLQDKWKTIDFIQSYAKQGNVNYQNFLKLYSMFKTDINVVALLHLCIEKDPKRVDTPNLNLPASKVADVIKILQSLLEIRKYFEDACRYKFVIAYKIAYNTPGFNPERFIHSLSYQRDSLYPCIKAVQYLKLIEKIYNYKLRKTEQIFFLATHI